MKKQLRTLIIVSLIVVVLGGVLIYFTLNPKNSDDSLSYTSSNNTGVALWNYTVEQISKVHVENESGSFDVVQNGEDGFIISELAQLPENSLAYTAVNSLGELTATELVEQNSDDISIYGLDNPRSKVQIEFVDNTTKTLLIGNNAAKVASVYIMIDGERDVYIIDEAYVSISSKTQKDFISLNVTGVSDNPENIDVKKISYLGSAVLEEMVVESSTEAQETLGMSTGLVITSPFLHDVRGDIVGTVDQTAVNIKANGVVEIFPEQEILEKYGLSDPAYIMNVEYVHMKSGEGENSIEYEDGEYKILVGSSTDDNTAYYVMRDGVPVIYEVSTDKIPWINFTPKSISSNIQFMPYINDISSVNIKTDDKEFNFELTLTDKEVSEENSESSTSETEKELSVTGNGNDIDTAKFRTLYQLILGCLGEKPLDTIPDNTEPYLTISYKFVDNSKDDVEVQLIPIDDRNYAISVDGITLFSIRASYATALINNCEKILAGEEVSASWT